MIGRRGALARLSSACRLLHGVDGGDWAMGQFPFRG